MAGVRIITLPLDRWPEYRELRLEALKEAPQAFGSSYAGDARQPEEHWTGRLREAEEGRSVSLFAEHEGRLVGMIGAFFPDGPEVAMVVAMYVSPAYRGAGTGRMLVDAVLERLREFPGTQRASLMVNVEQSAAVRLYRSAGFVAVGSERVPMGDGQVYDELIMECSLR